MKPLAFCAFSLFPFSVNCFDIPDTSTSGAVVLSKFLTAKVLLYQQFIKVDRLPWLWNSMVLVMRKP
jgi:hypothetical protein